MNEQPEQQSAAPSQTNEQELKMMIARLQQQLGFLEKKIDLLMARMDERPGAAQPPYRPAPRSFDDKGRRPEGGFSGGFRGKRPWSGPRNDGERGAGQPQSTGSDRPAHGFQKFINRDTRGGFGPRKPFPSKRGGGYRR